MAVNNETSKATTATGRRLFFGANVTVLVLLAAVVLVFVNLIGHRENLRTDLGGGFGSTRLSPRTETILEKAPSDLRITAVYTSDEPDMGRKEYLPRLQDYLDEMLQFKRSIKVQYLHTGNERAELRNRVQGKFGTAAEKYKGTIDLAGHAWTNVQQVLQAQQVLIAEQMKGDSWLSGFTTLANINSTIRKDLEEIDSTRRELNDLVRGEGIPRYQEANNKIKTENDTLKGHLETFQTWLKDTDKLVQVLSDANSPFAAKSRENLAVMQGLLLNIRNAVGKAGDREIAGNPKEILLAYAKAANAMSTWLFDEYNRVGTFVKENPAIEQHPAWSVEVQMSILQTTLPLHQLLREAGNQLGENVQVVRQVLAGKAKSDDLSEKNLVIGLRQNTTGLEKMLQVWSSRLESVLGEAGKIDPGSKEFLAKGASGEVFEVASLSKEAATQPAGGKETIMAQLTDLNAKIEALPKLELDEIADRLKEDNLVILETDKLVRVVPFDEVWPAAAPDAAPMGGEEKKKLHRVFDGDRAIANAINSMVSTQKVATVIFVGFEPEVPPQMRQFQRPTVGPIPLNQINVLKEKLEKANFAVKTWNMGGQGEDAKEPPKPEEGTKPVYVFLPPAEAPPPNPMMQQQAPPPSFGPEQLAKVKELLGKDAHAIFLAVADAMPRTMPWDPPASYAYQEMLDKDWGIDVKFNYRVVRGVRDPQRPDHFNIDLVGWSFMPLSYFTDHPIGAPLKARRLLTTEACPVVVEQKPPEGVKLSPVLDVPADVQDVWAESDIARVFAALREGRRDSTFTKSDQAMTEGFPVIVAGENSKTHSKIVVMGTGISFVDPYVSRPVPRIEGGRTAILVTDPPPMENVDLAMNALYWLIDKTDMIAAGPAPIPLVGQVNSSQRNTVWMVAVGWAFAALVLGGIVMFVRRK